MKNRFRVDIQDRLVNSLLFIALSSMGIFAIFTIQEIINSEEKIDFIYYILNIFCLVIFCFSMFCLFICFKNLKRHFSNEYLEIIFYTDRVEFPKILVSGFSLSDKEKVTVELSEIEKIKILVSINAGVSFVKIKYTKKGKVKCLDVSNKIFPDEIQFREFLNKLKELNLTFEK